MWWNAFQTRVIDQLCIKVFFYCKNFFFFYKIVFVYYELMAVFFPKTPKARIGDKNGRGNYFFFHNYQMSLILCLKLALVRFFLEKKHRHDPRNYILKKIWRFEEMITFRLGLLNRNKIIFVRKKMSFTWKMFSLVDAARKFSFLRNSNKR